MNIVQTQVQHKTNHLEPQGSHHLEPQQQAEAGAIWASAALMECDARAR